MPKPNNRRNRAFFLTDAIVGLGILAVLGVVLATEVGWHTQAMQKLANRRAASHLAESAVFQLQQGRRLPNVTGQVTVQPLTNLGAVPRYQWVRVVANDEGQTAALVGLVRRDALGGK